MTAGCIPCIVYPLPGTNIASQNKSKHYSLFALWKLFANLNLVSHIKYLIYSCCLREGAKYRVKRRLLCIFARPTKHPFKILILSCQKTALWLHYRSVCRSVGHNFLHYLTDKAIQETCDPLEMWWEWQSGLTSQPRHFSDCKCPPPHPEILQ